eukprot:1295336-Pyramimonas_sp.AAC.1
MGHFGPRSAKCSHPQTTIRHFFQSAQMPLVDLPLQRFRLSGIASSVGTDHGTRSALITNGGLDCRSSLVTASTSCARAVHAGERCRYSVRQLP